jgi:2-polyprenyl-3-methyl-5-hydroxy-6-metoxy-1,4-benzoquinol methylase
MFNHVDWRTDTDRAFVIPWLASLFPLRGCRILEIGCGTGASTVTLAEQGCEVTAVDVNIGNLSAGRERCRIYDLKAQFYCHNATELREVFSASSFDVILFFATLEHLTYAERLASMKSTWDMLAPGGFWGVIDTPNRLWWLDNHTAFLPFFHWLPDDLALDYAPHSSRLFMKAYALEKRDDATNLDFARRGRGVSYHEFDLTLGESAALAVVSAMDLYVRDHNLVMRAKWTASQDRKYEKMLRSLGPKIHRGFYQPYLNLILRKP